MRKNTAKLCELFVCCIALFAMPMRSIAALGGQMESVRADQTHMKGVLHITAQSNYSIHEIQTSSGTLVREYVNSSGVVFGIAWNGHAIPDLRQLLGSYFNQYTESAKLQRQGHSRLSIAHPKFVAHSAGHMRAFFGNAYVPQLLPENVTPALIQ